MSSAHRDRHDAAPTVTEFASLAETSRGTAARQPSWKGATDGHHCAVNAKSDPVTAAAGRADYQSEAGFSLGETSPSKGHEPGLAHPAAPLVLVVIEQVGRAGEAGR